MKTARHWWRISKDESGQALILGAGCMSLLMAVMALAVDIGYMHYRQMQLQTAADSAAIAAGLENGTCAQTVCSNMETAAAQALKEDGITSATITPSANKCSVPTSTGLAMIINVAPCVLSSDPNKGNAYMTEVVLTEPQSTFFGNALGIRKFNLVARAEAGEAYYLDTGGGNCIYTQYLLMNSGSNLDLNNCGVYDGGNFATDSGASATATTFIYGGLWTPDDCNGKSCRWTLGGGQTQPTHTNQTQKDPYAHLTAPTQPAISSTNTQTPNGGTTLQPGYYPNGFNINSGNTVNLAPGLYYMGGSINVDDGANLTCTGCSSGSGGPGVTLYFVGGSFQANSGSTVQLSAPGAGWASSSANTTGAVGNMLLWSPESGSGTEIDSGSRSYFTGAIYLPNQTLTLNSGSGVVMNNGSIDTAIDVNSLIVDSGDHLQINGSGGYLGSGGMTLGSFALAE